MFNKVGLTSFRSTRSPVLMSSYMSYKSYKFDEKCNITDIVMKTTSDVLNQS